MDRQTHPTYHITHFLQTTLYLTPILFVLHLPPQVLLPPGCGLPPLPTATPPRPDHPTSWWRPDRRHCYPPCPFATAATLHTLPNRYYTGGFCHLHCINQDGLHRRRTTGLVRTPLPTTCTPHLLTVLPINYTCRPRQVQFLAFPPAPRRRRFIPTTVRFHTMPLVLPPPPRATTTRLSPPTDATTTLLHHCWTTPHLATVNVL